jgi:hypothetical protein
MVTTDVHYVTLIALLTHVQILLNGTPGYNQ